MRNRILALGLGLLFSVPAFAAGHGKHVVAKKAVVAEGEKPAEAKPAEGTKTTKKTKKTEKKAAEKPAEAAPAK
jgi:hypothetical protein